MEETMDRLTIRNSDGSVSQPTKTTVEDVFYRLADYEDAMPLDQAKELAQAEKDGRLLMLQCKFGDTIWVILDDGTVCEAKVNGISVVSTCDDIIIQFGGWPAVSVLGSGVGETWFFSKEEAEEVLKKREEAH